MLLNDHPSAKKKPLKVFYGSIHDILSYPTEIYDRDLVSAASLCLMEHGQYVWNVHLEKFNNKPHFQKLLHEKYFAIIQQAEIFFTGYKPDQCLLIISAGFDAHVKESPWMQRHGRNVPDSFYHEFTEEALKVAKKCCKGKVVSVLEGGYSDGALVHGTSSHIGALMGLGLEETKYRVVKPSSAPTHSAAASKASAPKVVAEATLASVQQPLMPAPSAVSSTPQYAASTVTTTDTEAVGGPRTRSKTGQKVSSPAHTPKHVEAQPLAQVAVPTTPSASSSSDSIAQITSSQKVKASPHGQHLPMSPPSPPEDEEINLMVTPQRQPSQTQTLITPPSPTQIPTTRFDSDEAIDIE